MNATITLGEYIEEKGYGKTFVIPNYQRGYIWGKNPVKKDKKDAVTYMIEDSLIPSFNNKTQVFIQGITVCEKDDTIILIDGQQRTTFFYLLLKYLGYTGDFQLKYEIRKESMEFLRSLDCVKSPIYKEKNVNEEFQDIFFFKKTLGIIDNVLNKIVNARKEHDAFNQFKTDFLKYLLENVRFLYIDIPEDKATKVFSMMNGSKALMKDEELIKAELLRLASLNDKDFEKKSDSEKYAIEWDNNMLRSRYAREWDKWLQWWNRDDVRKLFKHSNVMGFLVSTYLGTKKNETLSFNYFKNEFLRKQTAIEAKQTFNGLKRLQKRFEDAFNDAKTYNRVGAILRTGANTDEFIQWFFNSEKQPTESELIRYYKWSFLGLSHKEIVKKNTDAFDSKFDEKYQILDSNSLYNDYSEDAFCLLLRLNIDEDNKQEEGHGRKFDFSIWDRKDSRGRSLEHIYPKSKVLHKEIVGGRREIQDGTGTGVQKLPRKEEGYMARATCRYFEGGKRIEASEHSIGNLVLLYKDDNSAFNDSSFEEKKAMFFMAPDDKQKKSIFKSRHLLHTIYKFALSEWNGKQIAQNKYQTLEDFRKYYYGE